MMNHCITGCGSIYTYQIIHIQSFFFFQTEQQQVDCSEAEQKITLIVILPVKLSGIK